MEVLLLVLTFASTRNVENSLTLHMIKTLAVIEMIL
jgi:hypothetical protein